MILWSHGQFAIVTAALGGGGRRSDNSNSGEIVTT